MDSILIEDKKKLIMIQQHTINPELDINMCMFSELHPVMHDMILISNTPVTATTTYRMAYISTEVIIKIITPHTIK